MPPLNRRNESDSVNSELELAATSMLQTNIEFSQDMYQKNLDNKLNNHEKILALSQWLGFQKLPRGFPIIQIFEDLMQ